MTTYLKFIKTDEKKKIDTASFYLDDVVFK